MAGVPCDPLGWSEPDGASRAAALGGAGSESTPEQLVAQVWQEALGREGPHADTTFFDAGGDSLTAAEIAAAVHDLFGVELELGVFDAQLTVGRLAALIEERSAAGSWQLPAPERRAARDGIVPVSAAQRHIWQRAPKMGAAWNMTGGLRLHGTLDVEALHVALHKLVERHDILRTGFVERDGAPVAIVHSDVRMELPVADLRGRSDVDELLQPLLERLASQPFDLGAPPLLLVRLVRVSETEHWLLRSWHHLVCDAASSAIFADELGSLYESLRPGRPRSPPGPPRVQYSDYAFWEEANIRPGSSRWTAEVEWWRRHLEGVAPTPSFPFSREPGESADGDATEAAVADLEPEVSAALDRLGRELGATLFMTRVAAFAALCALDGGSNDLVLGTNVTMRRFASLRRTIGPMSNSTVLRLNLSADATFRDWIKAVRGEVTDVARHALIPFGAVAGELARRGVRTPTISVRFSVPGRPPRAQCTNLELVGIPRLRTVSGALVFEARRSSTADNWRAVFDPRAFDHAAVEVFLERLRALVAVATAAPDRPLLELHASL